MNWDLKFWPFCNQVNKEAKLVKQQRMVVRSCSSGSAQNGDVDGFSLKPNKLFVQEMSFHGFFL